jgi:SPP1 gp7 family putative phage head morphogenesis protein
VAAELDALRLALAWSRGFRVAVEREIVPHIRELAPGVKFDTDDAFSRYFAGLEFAISDLLSAPKLAPDLLDNFGMIDRHSRAEMTRVLAIDAAGEIPATLLNDYITRNVELIRTAGLGQVEAVKDLILSATREQISYADLSAQLQRTYEVTEARANLIARDQVLKANSELNKVRAEAAGVKRYVWRTSQDIRVRGTPGGRWPKGTHYGLNGTIHEWNDPPTVDFKSGRKEHPGQDYQCRCIAEPMVDDLLYG